MINQYNGIEKIRIGEQNYNTMGQLMTIVDYIDNRTVTVEFDGTGRTKICEYQNFQRGTVKDNFYPRVYGMGYLGNGVSQEKGAKDKKKSYKVWHSMLMRCYDKGVHKTHPTYIECNVCDEWLCYETFEKWFDKNYYTVGDERMTLDKDILFKRNKIYSPDTCIFVPERINGMFVRRNKDRGKYPIGVSYDSGHKKFKANVSIIIGRNEYKNHCLGFYDTAEEAFAAYKKAKEEQIKIVADKYKDKIPQKLYDALYGYEVEITD